MCGMLKDVYRLSFLGQFKMFLSPVVQLPPALETSASPAKLVGWEGCYSTMSDHLPQQFKLR